MSCFLKRKKKLFCPFLLKTIKIKICQLPRSKKSNHNSKAKQDYFYCPRYFSRFDVFSKFYNCTSTWNYVKS